MSYQIHFKYSTGDTFNHFDGRDGSLPEIYKSLDEAKIALSRMQEHYTWYTEINSAYARYKDQVTKPSWLLRYDPSRDDDYYENQVMFNVILDQGIKWVSGSQYCGYFESLESAEIKNLVDEGLSFKV